jgi:predicted  nucleic acid-binding Zn-ribbon protein
MWEKLAGFITAVITLNETLKKNQEEIKQLQMQQVAASEALREIVMQIKHSREIEEREREKIVLALENELLKFQNQLPPSK